MRTVSLGQNGGGTKSLFLNGKPLFVSGWLDQSWWPDGQYTAPTDEALAFDLFFNFTFNGSFLSERVNDDTEENPNHNIFRSI